jgi:hypothetical protein
MVRKFVGPVNTYADATRAYMYVSFIWHRNIGGITVQRALGLLRQASIKTSPGDSLYRKIVTLTDEIIHNNISPAEVGMDETASA